MSHHTCLKTSIHYKWNNALPPTLTVDSGSTITFDLVDGGDNQILPTSNVSAIHAYDFSRTDPATGPIYINTALPGDVLKIDFLRLIPGDYGWTALFPDFGLLSAEFPQPELKIWDLSLKTHAVFKRGIHIPIRPFLGVVGVAREQRGDWSTIPPYETGGNIDTKYITEGATLYLPVQVPGALLSVGDGHAAQGDGEVCGTAIECPMRATVRVSVVKDVRYVTSPHYLTAPAAPIPGLEVGVTRGKEPDTRCYAAVGIDAELLEAARKAVRGAIAWLVAEKGLSRVEAYMLCSVAGDLKITEAVDMPHFAVALSIPLSIFVE
jgi:acetamidase/formamidase